jgi:nitrite reductase (NO-forming)
MWQRIRDFLVNWGILSTGVVVVALFLVAIPLSQSARNAAPPAQSNGPAAAQTAKPTDRTAQSGGTSPAQAPLPSDRTSNASPNPPRPSAPDQPASTNAPADKPPPAAVPSSSQHDHTISQVSPSSQSQSQVSPGSQSQSQVSPSSLSQTSGQAPSQPTSASGGDATAGRLVFRKCQACHSLEPGKNLVGPSLAGIIGRKAGAEPNYNYSPAMKQANITWDEKTFDAYLADPQKVVPGNKMPFPGLKTDHDRQDILAFLESAKAGQPAGAAPVQQAQQQTQNAPSAQAPQNAPAPRTEYVADARYTLRSGIAEGRMVYLGVGGAIDGKVNPVLTASEGQVVQLTLINGEGAEHDIVFPDQDTRSPRVTGKGASTTIAFRAAKSGDFKYFCSVPGHQQAGMEGQFIVTPSPPPQTLVEADISREPTDLPPPIAKREPQTVRVDLVSVEVEGRLAEATTFGYWTFNGKVPGPFIRVRVGDTIDIHLKNSADSSMIHSVDFHAATGPGGGAAVLQVDPGKEKSMTWKALVPGLYVYHCATPMVAEHIANGMYGLILVEPEEGLPHVDHEFYVMQGEIYTDSPFGQHGSQEFSVEKLLNERPEYFVFNGSVGAISKLHQLKAKVGDTVRIFFGVGGPSFTSSFHVIGEIFDKVYLFGGTQAPALQGIQTVTVPPGGAVITEFKLDVPGNYTLVDHAIARMERGLVGILSVEGAANPEIFNGVAMPGMGH